MPKYAIHEQKPAVFGGFLHASPTHEIAVTWEEGESRPPFLPMGSVIELEDGQFWQVVTGIHCVARNGEPESFSYLVREM